MGSTAAAAIATWGRGHLQATSSCLPCWPCHCHQMSHKQHTCLSLRYVHAVCSCVHDKQTKDSSRCVQAAAKVLLGRTHLMYGCAELEFEHRVMIRPCCCLLLVADCAAVVTCCNCRLGCTSTRASWQDMWPTMHQILSQHPRCVLSARQLPAVAREHPCCTMWVHVLSACISTACHNRAGQNNTQSQNLQHTTGLGRTICSHETYHTQQGYAEQYTVTKLATGNGAQQLFAAAQRLRLLAILS
jgi:hypothetical protein